MIFKDYYFEDIVLRKFFLYSTPLCDSNLIIKKGDKRYEFKRPKNIDDFIKKIFFDVEDYDEILIINDNAKVLYSKQNKEFKVLGNKEYTKVFNAIEELLLSEEIEFTLSQSIGIEPKDKDYFSKEFECDVYIDCRTGYYIINLDDYDNSVDDLSTILQIYIYNYCQKENLNMDKLFLLASSFLNNFGQEIDLYIDTVNVDRIIFPFVNNSQNIFLIILVNYLLIYDKMKREKTDIPSDNLFNDSLSK